MLAIAAAALLAIALVGIAQRAAEKPRTEVGRNVSVDRGGVIDARNSPSLARHPDVKERVVATHRVDRPRFSAALDWSRDGGRQWKRTALPLPRGLDRPYAPDAAFGPDGVLYVTYVNLTGTGNVPANLWLSKSSDGGQTLSRPVRVAGRLAFQARVAVDRAGTVHMTWLQGREVGLLRLSGSPSPVVAVRSSDGGRTFSRPARVSDPARERVGAASPVIDTDGELVVLYEDFAGDRRDFENVEGVMPRDPFQLLVSRPVRPGVFSRGVVAERRVVPGERFLVFTPEFPSLAAGPGDSLYLAWADRRNGDEDVFLRRSGDDGRSWSAPVRVNDNPKRDGTSQYLPRVDVAPDGRVDVLFLDRRRDRRDVITDATLASSEDDGASFRNTRLSSTSFDSRVGPRPAEPFPVDFGSRLGLLSEDGSSLAAWTDTRRGDENTGRQDVYAAPYDVAKSYALPSRLPVIAVLLLGALGLGLAAVDKLPLR